MKLTNCIVTLATTLVSARPQDDAQPPNPHEWMAPGPNDFRGPCPMLNTLANHGFLPRDGRNITKDNAIAGFNDGLNFKASLGALLWDQAIIANPEPNATFFTLDHLNVHNLLEHDASLTRADAALGNNHIFNKTVYEASRQWWTEEIVTPEMLANSKIFRQLESRAKNPEYRFTATTEAFSLGEVAAPVVAFGDFETGSVNRTLMEYFFELGWTKKSDEVTAKDITGMTTVIGKATNLLTGGTNDMESMPHGKRNLHSGMF
ncbi:Cloroperoxidase [Decorospora gaudefroyi]|uniref:Cloroperoxidase n=1 Tax=Decorospora gaudefroyi TaxID=184978 RepID=A0A6A5K4E9_9PLEO|nr:Cloroperoxidase [Decorospora gaudefroyi]